MMKKRRNDDNDRENLERWLITYADLITLLLVFFIMMYTFSRQDAQKHQEVAQRLKAIFRNGPSAVKQGGAAGAFWAPGPPTAPTHPRIHASTQLAIARMPLLRDH